MKKYINATFLLCTMLFFACSKAQKPVNHYVVMAKKAFVYCKNNNLDTNFCILIDFSIASGKNRLVLWDFKNQKDSLIGLCTQGSCSGINQSSNTNNQVQFSNVPNSHCSSNGKFTIGIRSYSSWGINIHYKLHGLENHNNKVYERVIVLHSWDAVPNHEIYPNQLVQSWGCPAVSNELMRKLDVVLQKQKKPTLLWIYTPNENTKSLADCAIELTKDEVQYDPSYFTIPYPMGDVPKNKGVCTDVVIRAYRKLGIDLQQLVHEDMKTNFNVYPKNWGLQHPDKNIDHRRVPNLMTFFTRKGTVLPVTQLASNYKAGDIVCWNLGGGITHIGIVSNQINNGIPLIIHNVGGGQVIEDVLFKYHKIIGHYRY
jgi:uncharacterized protein YijF (DUF1287 family)